MPHAISQKKLEGVTLGLEAFRVATLRDPESACASLFAILKDRLKVESEAIATEAKMLLDLSADPKMGKVYRLSEKLAPRSERSA